MTTDKKILNPSENLPITLPILIVEDDVDDSTIMEDIIKEFSSAYAITALNKGEKVMERLESLQPTELPSLIILDYNMAPVSGIEVLKLLKAAPEFQHIPVAVYSHSTYPKHKEECLQAGACIYLSKSNTLKDVKEDLRQMLAYCLHG